MDAFDSCLLALEYTDDLEVGGVAAMSRNARINQNRRNGANGGNSGGGIIYFP